MRSIFFHYIWQLLAELAIAAEYNGGRASGVLTDGYVWRFCSVVKRTDTGFDVRMADDQQLFTQTLQVGDFTVSALNFFCDAVFPRRQTLSYRDVSTAFSIVDSRIQNEISLAARSIAILERQRADDLEKELFELRQKYET